MARYFAFSSGFRAKTTSKLFLGIALACASLIIPTGCGSGGGQSQSNQTPQFTNFDAPGADQTGPKGTFGIGTNSNGDVVGYFIDSNNALHGFLRSGSGSITTVDAPGAGTQQYLGTEAVAINTTGEITGFFLSTQLTQHSYIRSASGTFTAFDPPGSFASGAESVNESGTVAGGFTDANGAHGYLRAADGTLTTFDPTGDPTQVRIVIPAQINASGAVAGVYFDANSVSHGFYRDPNGAMTLFDAPGAGTTAGEGTLAYDMNGNGVIVGQVTTGSGSGLAIGHSFMRAADGTITEFDPPAAGPDGSIADGINDSGAIVGTYLDANLVRHGYLRKPDGTFVTLDDPSAAQLAASTTNLDTVPRRINASGAVIGLFSDPNGIRHAFIWQ